MYRIKRIGVFYYPQYSWFIFWCHFSRSGITVSFETLDEALDFIVRWKSQQQSGIVWRGT